MTPSIRPDGFRCGVALSGRLIREDALVDRRRMYNIAHQRPNDPVLSAPGSWQRIGGESPLRGRSSQPPRPRVMHEVLLARAAVKRSQGRPRAEYIARSSPDSPLADVVSDSPSGEYGTPIHERSAWLKLAFPEGADAPPRFGPVLIRLTHTKQLQSQRRTDGCHALSPVPSSKEVAHRS